MDKMTYTTQQLQAMSDHTINHALYAKLYYSSNVDLPKFCPEYCNNPNDIMPLAFERGISLISLSDGYMATKIKDIYMAEQYRSLRFCDPSDEEYADTNPLRAIACLLLMIED